MKQTVVLTAELPDIASSILSREFEVITHPAMGPRTEEEMISLVSDADGLITLVSDPMTRRVLQSNPNLRIVGNYAVGTNNIDVAAARELGIVVTNTPDVLTEATADLTLALILAVTRRIIEGDRMVREGRFTGWQPKLLLGHSLGGKRLGIIGMGRIGHAVAKRALAFGMEIAHHSRARHLDVERELGAAWLPLDQLLRTSDIVSIHAPLTTETKYLIDRDALAMMRRSAWLINTSRGPIVDETALAEALEEGRLRGAGLDVFENEPVIEPRLVSLPNVVLLPHIGSATEETRKEMARIVANDVARVLRGGQPKHTVVP